MAKFQGRYRIESARLPGWDYRTPGWYFVTICTRDRIPFLGRIVDGHVLLSPIGLIVAKEWQWTPQVRPNIVLDEWVIMPNHLHGIVVIVDPDVVAVETPRVVVETPRRGVSTTTTTPGRLMAGSLGAIIGQIKSICTKRIRAAGHADFGWQPRFYDHIIRDDAALQRIRTYIANNPKNWTDDRFYLTASTTSGKGTN
jgi:REP element-mobilizing transposase RayT